MNQHIINTAVKRIIKFNLNKKILIHPLNKIENVKAYCELLNLPVPFKKDMSKFVVTEYKNPLSPIFKDKKQLVIKRKKKSTKTTRKIEYNKYLNSVKWKDFKKKLINDRGTCCESCGKDGLILDGHHKTYVRLFNELPQDVLLVCRNCHKKIHNIKC